MIIRCFNRHVVPEVQGRTKKEAIRCLKRFIAREIYHHLPRHQLILDSP